MSDQGEAKADAKKGDLHLVETKVSSEPVFDGKLLHVRRDTVRLPDGSLATRWRRSATKCTRSTSSGATIISFCGIVASRAASAAFSSMT